MIIDTMKRSTVLKQDNRKVHTWSSQLRTRGFQFTLDLLILIAAFAISYLLRFDFHVPDDYSFNGRMQLPLVVLIQLLAMHLCGIYNFIWRYVGMAEIKAFLKAALLSFLVIAGIRFFITEQFQEWRVPLSIALIDVGLAFGGVLGVRVFRRNIYERFEKSGDAPSEKPKRVLLIGAGRAGVMVIKEVSGRGDLALDIRGFIDDDRMKKGAIISGIKVLGTTNDLARLVGQEGIDHVIISLVQASRQEYRRILNLCAEVPVKVKTIPGLYEILQGRVEVSRIREVQIEDLLGREAITLEVDNMRNLLKGKRVMVTGAGGSIGSELARQVARFSPSSLILVERAEPALFYIDKELKENAFSFQIVPLVVDIRDEVKMRAIFAGYQPQIVIHAAAHKHVTMMELNPTEAVKNNSLATQLLGTIAGECGVDTFVLISTDKAVRPTSIMGASKRLAELIIQYLGRKFKTKYVAVRFGNVIGSTGSVIPIFREQIRKGGPVTVTHPEMIRYFMTIPEAAQLVLQAAVIGEGGEIFVLDMGEPVKIVDLAKDLITLSGFTPFEDIDIVFTGVRPGEKLFEELNTEGEDVSKTRHPKIFIGKIEAPPKYKVQRAIEDLVLISMLEQPDEVRRVLTDLIPESNLILLNSKTEEDLGVPVPKIIRDMEQVEYLHPAHSPNVS
jgi:FlaA1/EpsC-like NDP-sugar epimerase